ncbi:Ig-like domain-containing protein [Actinomadura fulvescens]|uniref:Ig-like domain-containing protein n=1 Tax=Actinomadura fulvescens TaxID=46160 RepID=UPI0031CFE6E4
MPGLRLGARIDGETGPGRSGRGHAKADDRRRHDDEDALRRGLRIAKCGAFRRTLHVRNKTRRTATLAGWIDANRDGTFGRGERAVTRVRPGARKATLRWGRFGRRSSGATFVRLRLYGGRVANPRPAGSARSGEAEDHRAWRRCGKPRPPKSPSFRPFITSPRNGAHLRRRTFQITGKGRPGARATVRFTGAGGPMSLSGPVSRSGTWRIPVRQPLSDGRYRLVPSVGGPCCRTVGGPAVRITVDATAPTPPKLGFPAKGAKGTDPRPLLSGTAEPGTKVKITLDTDELCTATVQPSGAWRCTPCVDLLPGNNVLTLTAVDAAGNTSKVTSRTVTIVKAKRR